MVGLPNVGKSTLFNALVEGSQAATANFPFCTIEPNTGTVVMDDMRLEALADINKSVQTVQATLTFVDIAGLVEGASKGQGLGNKFLSDIRQCDALVHVVRCFDIEKEDTIHVLDGAIDPIRDAAIINSELLLADLGQVERRLARKGGKTGPAEREALVQLQSVMEEGTPVRSVLGGLSKEAKGIVRELGLLTAKPMIYAANLPDDDLGAISAGTEDAASSSASLKLLEDLRRSADEECVPVVPVSAQLEAELMDLEAPDRAEYLASIDVDVKFTASHALVAAASRLLDLMVFYTSGPTETRAWQCARGTKAPAAAGLIHTDLQRGFIRAETVAYDDMIRCGSEKAAREQGVLRSEGKDYTVEDGDVVLFRFNV